MKLLDCTAALVIPNSCVLAVAGLGLTPFDGAPPRASLCRVVCSHASFGTIVVSPYSLSPLCVIFTHLARLELIWRTSKRSITRPGSRFVSPAVSMRSEEHTSELQSLA